MSMLKFATRMSWEILKILAFTMLMLALMQVYINSTNDRWYMPAEDAPQKKLTYKGYEHNPEAIHSPIIRLHNPDKRFYCTGFVIDKNYAITAAHCIQNRFGMMETDKILVHNLKGKMTIEAKAVSANSRLDYGLISGDFSQFQNTRIRHKKVDLDPERKTYVACGFPLGQSKLNCTKVKLVGTDFFAIAARGHLYPGMSGGPVFERETGTVVGVNSYVREGIVAFAPLIGFPSAMGIENKAK